MDFAKLLAKLDSIDSKKTLNEGWDEMTKAVKDREAEKGTGKFDKKKVSTGTVYTKKADKDHSEESDEVKKSKKKVKESESKIDEDDVEEGNKFTGNLAKARAAGKKEADLDGDGDMEPVKEAKEKDSDDKEEKCDDCGKPEDDCECDDHDHKDKEKVDENLVAPGQVKWATANAERFVNHYTAKGRTVQEAMNILYKTSHERARKLAESQKMSECYEQAMGSEQDSGMNISSNVDTQTGNKSLTISARGQAAEELAQILKLSGLAGHSHDMKPEIEVMAQEEYANEPKPVVQGMQVQMQQGNDLNRPKGTYPKVAGGDNPMQAMMEDKELKILESRLMKELESIKIKK